MLILYAKLFFTKYVNLIIRCRILVLLKKLTVDLIKNSLYLSIRQKSVAAMKYWNLKISISASLNRPKLGMVELTMMFDYNANILYVTIIQGKNLKTFGGTNIAKPDAFILGYLLPKRTMATMRKTCYVRIHHMFSRILNFLF